ncbi:MAG: MFS transporter [Planctomycetes bacterium]|nr:MFS transporter [Planctomycetota bacterium]
MLFRFSLYGFLKNLRFFDAFLLLALRERGLSFAEIGALVSIREVAVLLLEVPSGAIADTLGRRRCMVASMLGYVAFSALFWQADAFWLLAIGMLGYGVGDAFRSGTHKAMILAWLRQHDRLDDKTEVYGFTRSWSQIGSALSALGGGAVLLSGADYATMFLVYGLISIANLVNLATYPAALERGGGDSDGEGASDGDGGALVATYRRLVRSAKNVATDRQLRPVLFSGVVVRGAYKVAKDYLQPLLQALVLGMSFGLSWDDQQRTGALVGVVSAVLFVLSSVASRQAHRFERIFANEDRAARALTTSFAALFGLVGAAAWLGGPWFAVALFVLLAIANNLWRPVQVGRLGAIGDGDDQATVLSLESQLGALLAAALAPLVGWLVDLLADGVEPTPASALAPLALLAVPALLARAWQPRRAG